MKLKPTVRDQIIFTAGMNWQSINQMLDDEILEKIDSKTCPPEFDKVVTEQFWELI
jgi:hypothetical protein